MNRAFLLFSLVFAVVTPLVILPNEQYAERTLLQVNVLPGIFTEHVGQPESRDSNPAPEFDYALAFYGMYWIMVVLILLRSAAGIRQILKIMNDSSVEKFEGTKVFRTKAHTSFCFVNNIVLSETSDRSVLLHEHAHARQYHWVDLAIMEVLCAWFWVNPLMWASRSALRQEHEYLADEYVLRQGVPTEVYLQSILQSISFVEPIGPVNKFNSKSLKKRITMMTKRKLPSYLKMLYALAVPLVALLFLSFAGRSNTNLPPNPRVVAIDAAHGGEDHGSRSSSGVEEKDLTLTVANLVKEIGHREGLTVVLTRTVDKTMTLQERVAAPSEAKADLFVSLHLAHDADVALKGIDVFVSDEHSNYSECKRLGSLLLNELKTAKGLTINGVKNSPAYVLKNNRVPAAIIELGYLSNESDAKFMSEPKNQRLLAEKIVQALKKF